MMYFIICLVATALGAIGGIGGGMIIKPVMDAISDMPVATIDFLSGCTVLAMSVASLLRNSSSDAKNNPSKNTPLALGAAGGGILGKSMFGLIQWLVMNNTIISVIQNVLMIFITSGILVYMLFKNHIRTLQMKKTVTCAVIGLTLGALSSFLGIGGGPLNIIVLNYFFSFSIRAATVNSLYIILYSQLASLASVLIHWTIPSFSCLIMFTMVVGGILGGLVGRHVSRKISEKQIEMVFYILLTGIIMINIYNLIKFSYN